MSKEVQSCSITSLDVLGANQINHGVYLSKNPSFQITTVKLDGPDYLMWSRSAIFSIQSRSLYRYSTRESKKPETQIFYMTNGLQFFGYVIAASIHAT